MDFEKLKTVPLPDMGNDGENKILRDCFLNTVLTTVKETENGVFMITGDIPAMWLRDSSAQVMQYLRFCDLACVKELITSLLKRQFACIVCDPYANAFMENDRGVSQWKDYDKSDKMPKNVWERKFELDSLCYPLFLAVKYYETTKDGRIFDDGFYSALRTVLDVVEKERKHSERSTYFFHRQVPWRDRVWDVGKSNPEGEKGLVWTGFRPSDDECKYPYHIPDNMFLVTVLYRLQGMISDKELSKKCRETALELASLIEKYGITEVDGKRVYVAETDCLGNYLLSDDANVPSLLSIPYLEYPFIDEEVYENTREYILSSRNEYYYEGKVLRGIGSPHTPKNTVWHIALAMQGITAKTEEEKRACYEMLIASTVDGLMHEGVDVDDPRKFTREWFAWANSLFAEFVLRWKS